MSRKLICRRIAGLGSCMLLIFSKMLRAFPFAGLPTSMSFAINSFNPLYAPTRLRVNSQLRMHLHGFELLKPKVAKQFKRNMKRAIKQLALSKQVLTVHLCDDKEIKALNKQF